MKKTGILAAVLAAAAAAGIQAVPNHGGTSTTEARQGLPSQKPAGDLQRGLGVSAIARAMRLAYGSGGGQIAGGYRNLAGWTTRRYQRHAQKLRNRARNRRACRG